MMKDTALVVVDMLYDFIDGSMACAGAETAVQNALPWLEKEIPALFVCDCHPADHSSFAAQGGPWPPHCVEGTRGAEIHDALKPYADEACIFRKGRDRAVEQYSGFGGRNEAGQSLSEVLDILDIRNVLVCGIATEYCVRNTAEDLLRAGFNVTLLQDAIGYVDHAGHLEALEAMKKEGITLK